MASTFTDIVPGKSMHLIASPAVGSQPAQFKAAVHVAVNRRGTPAFRARVTSDGAEIRTTRNADVFSVVIDRSGMLDIRVELLSRNGEVIHTDRLRVEIPSIPGIGI
ncbi:MAG: hypothetical protein CMJ48_07990 [Planctomycetaceae bacterium]|nr:hypothetical protein [Planctomycetaceae bacterium]